LRESDEAGLFESSSDCATDAGQELLRPKADLTHGRLRAVLVGPQDDGSLAHWDMKAEFKPEDHFGEYLEQPVT
jgi:hypothetical protein